jgi:predicted small secreted protein
MKRQGLATVVLASALLLPLAGCAHTHAGVGVNVRLGAPVKIARGHAHSARCGHFKHRGNWYHAKNHHHAKKCGHKLKGGVWILVR